MHFNDPLKARDYERKTFEDHLEHLNKNLVNSIATKIQLNYKEFLFAELDGFKFQMRGEENQSILCQTTSNFRDKILETLAQYQH